MRLIVTLFLFLLVHIQLIAQAPQRISYQALVRNSSNGLVSSTQVGVRISILQGSATGTAVYAERHTPTTNENGLLTIEIGGGTVESGTFSSIAWANGPFFIKSETDPAGGTSYSITGTTQLLSVPYALYANTAGNGMPAGTQAGQMLYWDGVKWTTLPKGTNGQYLKWCNDTLTWGACIAQVKTIAVENIYYSGADINFVVTNDGGSPILESGIIWSAGNNPQYPSDSIKYTSAGSQLGYYRLDAESIEPQKMYYARSFAINEAGISYGNILSFTTSSSPNVPTLTIDSIRNITKTSANIWAKVTNDGGASVNAHGFVWDTLPNPTKNRYLNTSNNGSGLLYYTHLLQDLTPGTTYYVRAYATNAAGHGYSDELVFKTDTIPVIIPPLDPPKPDSVVDIDGNVYPVIKIANKHWISKNLDVTHYKNGDSIPQVQDAATWANLTTGAWCYYENQTANGTTYGKLYNWYAMNDPRGIAPEGWHVPTDDEWLAIIDSLGGSSVAGGKLKATTLWNSPNTGATNSSAFSGLPGGYRYYNGSFGYKGLFGNWWSSTPSQMSPYLGTYVQLSNDTAQIFGPHQFEKEYGYAIRLIWNY